MGQHHLGEFGARRLGYHLEAIRGGLLELGEQRLTGSVTATEFEIGGGPSCEGSIFKGWNQGKPFLGFGQGSHS